MTTMSDDGDRTCPLCAEEMDLTDQQLKPCKCGYEICVWCWHHIMEMAEKDGTEGRCPACRAPYNKERIVGTAAKCERIVAEVNAERRHKSQKTKPKTSAEARKHLSSVRVVQRNLVYIIGLPSNLSDESLLERKEYFGQYGKVLKVSISRPAGAAAQQASNTNTFSVYITYAREEEAIRCIQAVHNFVLEGKPLRACFGTTKYCHAWLRNTPCSNPDCLYLHDIGSQEDSFTKDEIISAYTRSRVPQIASNNLQHRSGNVLPPPADDVSDCVTVSGNKTAVKSAANNTTSLVKGSNSSSGKSTVLPAAASWGMRASNCRPLVASLACSQTPVKHKIETHNSSSTLSSVNASTKQTSAWHDDDVITARITEGRHVGHMDGLSGPSESAKPYVGRDCQTTVSDGSSEVHQIEACTFGASAWDDDVATASKIPIERHLVHMNGRSRPLEPLRFSVDRGCQTSGLDVSLRTTTDASRSSLVSLSCSSSPPASASEENEGISVPGNSTHLVNGTSPETLGRRSICSSPDEVSHDCTAVNGSIQSLCFGISSVNLDSCLEVDHPNNDEHQSSASNLCSTGMPKNSSLRLQQCYVDNRVEGLDSVVTQSYVLSSPHASRELSDWSSESQKQVFLPTGNEMEDPLLTVDDQSQRRSDVNNQPSCSSYLNHPLVTNYLSNCSWNNDVGSMHTSVDGDSWTLDRKVDKALLPLVEDESILLNKQVSLSNSYKPEKVLEFPETNFTDEKVKCLGRFNNEANIDKSASLDIGESSIISDILSLDFDPWDDSLSPANDFAKLLGESNKQDSPVLLSSSWKSPNSNQSRFSFARQENQANLLESSLREVDQAQKSFSSLYDPHRDGFQNGSLFSSFEGPNAIVNNNPVVSSNRHAGVSRAKISAPPGFSLPSKAPPPGFSFQDRYDQAYETTYTENNLHGSSSLGNQYQVQQSDNMADVEFIDPAILAVGRGRMPLGVNNSSLGLRSALPAQLSASETDPRLQLLMQQSISSHQNQRISDHIGDRFLPLNDVYTTSQLFAQNRTNLSPFAHLSLQQPRNSHASSNQWDGWNDIQTVNNVGMAEILRNERFGLNNYYSGNEEHKFHIPSAADLYNRAFGM